MSAWARALVVGCVLSWLAGGTSGCAVADAGEPIATQGDALGGGKVFGLGVDAPAALSSPHFAALQGGWKTSGFSLTGARIVFYMDPGGGSSFDAQVTKLHTWVDAVTGAGLTPVVAIAPANKDGCGPGRTCVLIDDATYRYRFHALLAEFPEVEAWGPVNEPDVLTPFRNPDPAGAVEQVVDFFVDAASVLDECRQSGGCAHVALFAGEFAGVNEGYWHRYVDKIASEVHAGRLAEFPHVWGFHPYGDTTSGNTHEVDAYDRFLGHVERTRGFGPGTLRVWITESGTLLEHHTITNPACRDNGKARAQFKGAGAVTSTTAPPRSRSSVRPVRPVVFTDTLRSRRDRARRNRVREGRRCTLRWAVARARRMRGAAPRSSRSWRSPRRWLSS